MSWGLTAVAGATIIGGAMSSNAAGKAADAQSAASQAGIESQERMFDKQLELMSPYRDAGYGAIEGLQGLLRPESRDALVSDYYGSQEFRTMQDASNRNIAGMASATGGLRGGNAKVDLAQVAPQLGLDYLNNLQNQYTGLANMGMGAASQGAQGAQNLGFQTSQLLGQQGQAQAQNQLAQANIWGGVAGDLAGLGYNYLNQPPSVGSTSGIGVI